MKRLICDECYKHIEVNSRIIAGDLTIFNVDSDLSLIHGGTTYSILRYGQHFCSGGECVMKYIAKKLAEYVGREVVNENN